MFVASLNLDLFFKKVFSNKRIAKHFLEDLLGVTITEIKFLSVENKITDDAVTVKFDFRCKIRGQYVVIEMQQKYKIDVIKRFYLYHAVSTALQLETLKPITVVKPDGETYTEKNYSTLEPVITIIWMVDDMLGFDEDYIAYTTLPEATKDFITDKKLWEHDLDSILEERKKVLQIIENDTKGLDFFTQNRLIYIFQKNIVKNKRINSSYYKWFDFASKSRNINNKEEDFNQYKNDKDMAEVINRLRKDKLTTEEADYASAFMSFEVAFERMRQEKEADRKQMLKAQRQITKTEHRIIQAEQEKAKAEQEKIKERVAKELLQLKMLKMLQIQGASLSEMAETLGISLEETAELVKRI